MQLPLAVAALVGLVSGIPLVEREALPAIVTFTEYVEVYTTVTAGGSAETPGAFFEKNPPHHWGGGNGRHRPSQSSAPPAQAPAPPEASSPAAPPAQSQAPPAGPPQSVPTDGPYDQVVVAHHNIHRGNHSAPDLVWDQALADTAMKIAQTCNYKHVTDLDGGGYGQNIAAGLPISSIHSVISDQFYNGEVDKFANDYGQPTPGDFDQAFESYGHFTQVVWLGTQSVGCYSFDCSNSGGLKGVDSNVPPIYHVCNYKPAGNFIGQFDKNVMRPLGWTTVH